MKGIVMNPALANVAFVKVFFSVILMALAGALLTGSPGNQGATVWVMAESTLELKLQAAYYSILFFATVLMSAHYIDKWKQLYTD